VPSRTSAAAGSVSRIVADTNVYISALNFAGTADEVLALGRAGVIQVFISPPILEEIETVLVRKFRWAAPRVREAVRTIRRFAVLVNPGEPVNLVRADEPDNRILECALAAGRRHDRHRRPPSPQAQAVPQHSDREPTPVPGRRDAAIAQSDEPFPVVGRAGIEGGYERLFGPRRIGRRGSFVWRQEGGPAWCR
jgi:uncharacterized protein